MTREEAIHHLYTYSSTNGSGQTTDEQHNEAKRMGIKALEQEPILDKIREQIKDYLRGVEITLEVLVENDPLRPKMEGAKDTLEECLNLIDKAETEAEDGKIAGEAAGDGADEHI